MPPRLGLGLRAVGAEEFCGAGGAHRVTAGRAVELREGLARRLPQVVALLCEALRRAATSDDVRVCRGRDAALRCLGTLVSWAPLASHVTPDLLRTLFGMVDSDVAAEQPLFGGLEAARCIDAVLSKRLVPPDFEGFVASVAAHVLSTLRTLAKALDVALMPRKALGDLSAQGL